MSDLYALLERADAIAARAHAGQTDKSGRAYISHPRRVSALCTTLKAKITALLHDTIEDTDITPEFLLQEGFPQDIVDAVLSVTHKKGEDYFDFVRRAAQNPIGREVKTADLQDNMDVRRLSPPLSLWDIDHLNKYLTAYKILTEEYPLP